MPDETPPVWRRPSRARTALVLAPGDLLTSTNNTAVTIAVPRRAMTDADVRELADRFDVVTWPERESVPVDVTYLDEALEHSAFSRVVLRPRVPLASRWYAIRGRLSEDERPAPDVAPEDGDGLVVSRFFPGSNPVLRRIVVTRSRAGGTDVQVTFSEPVRLEHNTLVVSIAGVDVPTCRIGNPGVLAATGGSDVVWLTCPEALDGSVAVRWTEPMFAADGVEARSGDGTSLDSMTIEVVPSASPRDSGSVEAQIHVPAFGLERGI